MNSNEQFLGIVQNGAFQCLSPGHSAGGFCRLTRIAKPESVPPEHKELDLTEYEGKAIMVYGHNGGGWIYSAEVIEQAGPILTAVVQKIFGQASEGS